MPIQFDEFRKPTFIESIKLDANQAFQRLLCKASKATEKATQNVSATSTGRYADMQASAHPSCFVRMDAWTANWCPR